MGRILCVDFGSTFTKAALVDQEGALLATGSTPTTLGTDVLDGYRTIRTLLARQTGLPDEQLASRVLACSSAGGGLRLAVVGYEREVTAEAGRRVGLSAGARLCHVASGPMSGADLAALRRSDPDLVLLVGGTDGGNAQVLVHNASRLAGARLGVPVVVAGNREASSEVAQALRRTGRRFVVTGNVLPRIGVVEPEPARAAIRRAFLEHVIGGKGLSGDPAFAEMVQAPTPDAVLEGVGVLAARLGSDVLVVDVGGATTDVYSVLRQAAQDGPAREVVAPLRQARTVEADLGVRWNAEGVVEAAGGEGLRLPEGAPAYAALLARDPRHLPGLPHERELDLELARAAALVAVRRHGRAQGPGAEPRRLTDVSVLVGSGGVVRHAGAAAATGLLRAVLADHAGGWRVPRAAGVLIDSDYLVFAVGLLRAEFPAAAARLAEAVVSAGP